MFGLIAMLARLGAIFNAVLLYWVNDTTTGNLTSKGHELVGSLVTIVEQTVAFFAKLSLLL